ncbi:MDR family MFS transporter [Saccharopolyspora gloriosae]|uniref:MDR family MFS transporter n=1 Tax=Saccharopolyspora gloriosae TaxID=455344 RepID=UPI001FB6502F|nr:MDR family MFS transporter [Saccharopolyspora gloriosae]
MTDTIRPVAGERPPLPSRAALISILVGLMLGMFLGALDTMIMASALRTVADQLHGLTLQAWVTTAYLVTMTVSAPLYGKLSDIYGRKPLYLTAILLFLAGSLLCGMAQSIYQLAAARAVQGLGAGGLTSLALAVVADISPAEKRSRYQANLGAVFALASVAGPVLGGLFAGADQILGIAGWRWIFLINLPIGLVACVLVALLLRVPNERVAHRVDFGGAITLVLCVFPLLVVAENGREWGWGSPLSLLSFAAGGVGLALFLTVQRRVGDGALLPGRLFRNLSFSLVNAVNFLGGIGVFAGLALLPLYLQIVQGLSPTAAGLLLLPQSLATTLGARNSSALTERFGYQPVLAAGMALMTVVFALLGQVGLQTPLWVLGVLVTCLGYGMGLFFQVILVAIQSSVPQSDLGLASGLYSFSRQIGGVAGTAVFVSLLFGIASSRAGEDFRAAAAEPPLRSALGDPGTLADPANAHLLDQLQNRGTVDFDDTSFLTHVDDRLAQPVLETFASSLNVVFLVVAGFLALSVLITLALQGRSMPAETESEERE